MTTEREKKNATLIIRIKPSVKAASEKRAQQDGRSLANYIEGLIVADVSERPSKARPF
jgi:predicted HicB family RNase H-like nuclease